MDDQQPQFTPKILPPPEEVPRLPVGQQLFLLSAILLLLLGGAVTPRLFAKSVVEEPKIPSLNPQNTDTLPLTTTPLKSEVFSGITLDATAAFVWDVTAQRMLYSKNPDEQLPLASITKLMTALIATELLSDTEVVTVNDTSIRQDGFSNLRSGESFTREILSALTLIESSNDGAYALASNAGSLLSTTDSANTFVKAMNIRAQELGLTNTHFKNPTGLDISSSESGAIGSARDVTFLMEYILKNHPELLEPTTELSASFTSNEGYAHEVNNTNYYLDEVPGLIGSKTGYTTLAGGNLVIAFNVGLNRPIIITVLGSTRHSRFTDVLALVAATQDDASMQ